MEDVITDVPPPSRFFQDDLNNFAPPSPPLPYPFLLFPPTDKTKIFQPDLLIFAISQPSIYLFHNFPPKSLIGSLVLPEISFSGNSTIPSLKDKSCNIYSLDDPEKSVLLVSFQYSLPPERAHSVAKLLLEKVVPQRVLILDTIKIQNFRGRVDGDESLAYKLETGFERKSSANEVGVDSSLLKGLDYLPSGSVVDGLGAALLSRCQIKKIKGTLCVAWPEFGHSVVSLVSSLIAKNVLPGFESRLIENVEDERLRTGWATNPLLESELYT